jgi:hypothetical protein
MTTDAPLTLNSNCYLPARDAFEKIVLWARGPGLLLEHGAQEEELKTRGTELLRRVSQAWLDERSRVDEREHAEAPTREGVVFRSYTRQIETGFGRLTLRRVGHQVAGQRTTFPLDKQMNLPADGYSHPLRQRVVEEARDRAWDHGIERVNRTTGGHVPKRQAQELAIKATQDVEEFYKQREVPKSLGGSALLLGSCDGKGVRMLPGALRQATQKAAAAEKAKAERGDPMQRKKLRLHDRRMAIVTAVWEQQREPRVAHDVVSELNRAPTDTNAPKRRARPQNKRVSASLQKSVSTSVAGIFDEFDRRDPGRVREVGMLVDGDEHQQTAILAEGQKRGRSLLVVLDIIHVIHYLWIAGFALCHRKRKATNLWLSTHLLMLLTSPVAEVIAAIETAATTKTLTAREHKSVNKALSYLRRNASFLDYPTYLARGLPIATGLIEGACRHLIQDRLGITGAKWGLVGAEAMLRLRALYSSGDWDEYWRYHLTKERLRNYPAEA